MCRKAMASPPLRLNRIMNVDNDATRSAVYNTRQDTLGWLRKQIEMKFKIPVHQQRITLYKSALEGAAGRL